MAGPTPAVKVHDTKSSDPIVHPLAATGFSGDLSIDLRTGAEQLLPNLGMPRAGTVQRFERTVQQCEGPGPKPVLPFQPIGW
jgi:hypothetical protein